MTDLTDFTAANAATDTKRVNWAERRPMIAARFENTVTTDFEAILDDGIAFERMVRDILKFAQSEAGRDGPRPNLDLEKGMQSWREITGQDFSSLAFHHAFRELTRDRSTGRFHSMREIANKTGISRSRVHRLLQGGETPDMPTLRQIAGAYGKKPQYFAEFRARVIADHVTVVLIANPEFSASVYNKVAGRL